MLSIGKGDKTVVYVGCCVGTDAQTSFALMRFVNEYCDYIATDGRVYGCSAAYLYSTRTVVVIPMLNPDGAEYCIHGISEDNPFYERLGKKTPDFSCWRANARGVELSNNFGGRIEDPSDICIEPESGALRNYLLFNRGVRLALSFHKAGQGSVCTHSGATPPRQDPIGRAIANYCSYTYTREGLENSLSYFCARELVIPAFDLYSEYSDISDLYYDYLRIRKALFLAPTLI